jgi:hypothetical protein
MLTVPVAADNIILFDNNRIIDRSKASIPRSCEVRERRGKNEVCRLILRQIFTFDYDGEKKRV